MPNAYKLLIGLTDVDSKASFYRREMPWFDGKRGCEGCERDVELMLGLTHYLGYEGATPKPLINEQATRANVLSALSMLADPGVMKPGDILFLFFSCHGRTYGEGPTVQRSAMVGSVINAVMLWNGPLYNFEIKERLLALPAGVRVFTVFDCCHAGFGSALEADGSEFAKLAQKATVDRFLSTANQRPAWQGSINILGGGQGGGAAAQPQGNPPGNAPAPARPAKGFAKVLDEFVNDLPAASIPAFVHYGAARDQATALGDPKGSLFTRMFYRTIAESVDTLNYVSFFKDLRFRLPARHTPVLETIPRLSDSSDGTEIIVPPPGHFSLTQNVLQI
jgi:hypothetical protein